MVGDVEVCWAALEVPDAGASLFDEVLVVGDEEDRSFVLLDGLVERVDALKVKVVRRFVEDEDVGLLQQKSRRAASPPESESVFLRPSSPLKSIWPRMPRISSLVACGSN
jgi:hypothetical protein